MQSETKHLFTVALIGVVGSYVGLVFLAYFTDTTYTVALMGLFVAIGSFVLGEMFSQEVL
jgi:uncharacterized membrane protein YeaQ/YmgE (transglycosylase-associated protein family)